jgi:hypothetical protein
VTEYLFDIPNRKPRAVYNGDVPARPVATSIAAAERMRMRAPSLRMKLLARARELGEQDITAKEAGDWYAAERSLPAGTASCRLSAAARLTELKLGGLLAECGRRRQTVSGAEAIVWGATNKDGDGRTVEVR